MGPSQGTGNDFKGFSGYVRSYLISKKLGERNFEEWNDKGG